MENLFSQFESPATTTTTTATAERPRRKRGGQFKSAKAEKSPKCAHCHKRKVKARGICEVCRFIPSVNEMYPSTSPFAKKNHIPTKNLVLPTPTDAIPGSEEKLRILCERAAAGQLLWHPSDLSLLENNDEFHRPVGGNPAALLVALAGIPVGIESDTEVDPDEDSE